MNIPNGLPDQKISEDFLPTDRRSGRSGNFTGSSVEACEPNVQIYNQDGCQSKPSISVLFGGLFGRVYAYSVKETIGKAFSASDTSAATGLISTYGAELLSKCKCPYRFRNYFYPGIPPFALACKSGTLDIVKSLFLDSWQLNQSFDCINGVSGRTPLMLAAMHGHVDVIRQLLEWKADPQIVDQIGASVDHISCAFNSISVARQIECLLRKYREENGLPQHSSIDDLERGLRILIDRPSCGTQ